MAKHSLKYPCAHATEFSVEGSQLSGLVPALLLPGVPAWVGPQQVKAVRSGPIACGNGSVRGGFAQDRARRRADAFLALAVLALLLASCFNQNAQQQTCCKIVELVLTEQGERYIVQSPAHRIIARPVSG